MSDEKMKIMMRTLGEQIFEKSTDPTGTVSILITETVKFRDKLKEDTGMILTVEDTQIALNAMEKFLNKEELPRDLTSEQKSLTQIWIDRLTVFNKGYTNI